MPVDSVDLSFRNDDKVRRQMFRKCRHAEEGLGPKVFL